MTLLFNIEYRTRWGEQLVLRLGRRRIALQYADGGVWTCAVERYAPAAQPAEYRYEVEREGVCIRREWRPHILRIPAAPAPRVLRIRDRWIDMPADTPFYSSAFTRGIFGRGESGPQQKNGGNITLRVVLPTLRPDEVLAVAGSGRELEGWQRIVPMDDSRFPEWELRLDARQRFEYKFLIADRRTLTPIMWEEGPNRPWNDLPGEGEHIVEAAAYLRFPERRWHGAGTAIPVFSLRSEAGFGVGEFYDLKLLIDWAAATGQRVLQLLPINDTTMSDTWEDSYPYNANSIFALHPQFIRLTAAGVEEDDEYRSLRDRLNALPEVDYQQVNTHKLRLLRSAFEREGRRTAARRDYREFMRNNSHWLMPYAAYRTLRDEFGTADFSRWGDYARYDKKAVEAYCRRNSREIAFHCFVQYHLHTQLSEVCAYARSRGVVLKGDLPIGVSRTSADAWIHPRLFHMDSQAGAPPDAFSASGQNWGFPTYDWEHDGAATAMRGGRPACAKMAEYFDAFRIDHILGFFRIWEIPVRCRCTACWAISIPPCPTPRDELARRMGFDTAGGRFTRSRGDRRPDAAANCSASWPTKCARRCIEGGHGCCPPSGDATQGRRAAFPATIRDRQRAAARRADGAARRRAVHRGPAPQRFFPPPHRGPIDLYATAPSHPQRRDTFDRLHDDFFYRRHNRFWQESALRKLPVLLSATRDAGLRRGPRHDSRQRSRNHARTANPFARNPADAQIAGRGVRRPGALPLFLGLHHLDPRHESPAGMVGGEP